MPYLNATEWLQQLPQVATVTASSTPLNIGEVATIIARISGEIDGAVAKAGYALPVSTTATIGYGYLQAVAEYGAGWKVLRHFMPNSGGPGDRSNLATEYKEAYQAALYSIRTGEQLIVGAGWDESGSLHELPRSYSTSHPAATVGVVPYFDMDWQS
jgi:hypothetical protein